MNSKNKGNVFEREMSRLLSLWWTNGKREDAIWRSASSGALASTSAGRYLAHTGDFAATDGDAELLFKHVIIEAKRGYNRYSMQDLLDVPEKSLAKNPVWEMVTKLGSVCYDQKKDGMLLWQRDRRNLLLFFRANPTSTHLGCLPIRPWLSFLSPDGSYFFGMPWGYFASNVSGAQIKSLLMTPVASSLSTQLTSS